MAQGQTLSVFVRLYQITGDPAIGPPPTGRSTASCSHGPILPRWRRGPSSSTTRVGTGSRSTRAAPIDYTFNGHVWAIYGLTDYWAMSGRAEASELALGAISAARSVAYCDPPVGDVQPLYCLNTAC